MPLNFQPLATTVLDARAALPISAAKADSSLTLHYHLVFYAGAGVTLSEEWRAQFYDFLSAFARGLGGRAVAGGTGSRVDLLVSLPPKASVSDFARRLKLLSASWARRKTTMRNFAWRETEQIFTVSRSQRRRVERQITKPAEPFRYFGTENQYALPQWCASDVQSEATVMRIQ